MDILITEEVDASAVRRLREKYEVVFDATLWSDGVKLREAISRSRCIMLRNQTRLTAQLLQAAPQLIGIGRIGVGLDNIDVEAASDRGVVVISPAGANAVSVAEMTLGLILALARKIPLANQSSKSGRWNRTACSGVELEGKTLGICGFGRIGRCVAARAGGFGMPLRVYDPFVSNDSPVFMPYHAIFDEQLEQLLGQADFVTVHTPLTPQTRHLFNANTFAQMKPGAFFVNTSRGGVVDEAALLQSLKAGRLAGAALDVREEEPPRYQSEFEAMENVILTPHIASYTREAQARTVQAVTEDVERLLSGLPAIHFVNFPRPRRG